MSREKLKKAIQLLQECLDEYEGEESAEGEDSSSDEGYDDSSDSMPMGGGINDKVKMAATLMKRGG